MQSRKSSFIEAFLNVFIGYWISFAGQLVIYPAFGAQFSLVDNLYIGLLFMMLSLARSYIIRRWFNNSLKRAAEKLSNNTK